MLGRYRLEAVIQRKTHFTVSIWSMGEGGTVQTTEKASEDEHFKAITEEERKTTWEKEK